MSARIDQFMKRPEVLEAKLSLADLFFPVIPSIGNEGIKEFVGDLLRSGKKRIAVSMDDKSEANLKATYQNDAWLAKRRFVEGQVSVPEGSLFGSNFEAAFNVVYNEIEKIANKNRAVVQKALTLSQRAVAFLEGPKGYDDKAAELFLKSCNLKYNPDLFGYDALVKKGEKATLPALTQAQVKTAVALLVKLSDQRVEIDPFQGNAAWAKAFYDADGKTRWKNAAPAHQKAVAEKVHYTKVLIEDLYDLGDQVESYYYEETGASQLVAIPYIKAMLAWIDASVK